MKVTRLERQKKNPSRTSVHLDGEYAFGASTELLFRLHIDVGVDVDAATRAQIEAADTEERAKNAALRFLRVRPRTEKEIRVYLLRKGYAEETGERMVRRLRESSLLNDEEFARMFVRDRLRLKPYGKTMLRRLLIAKGVSQAIADETLQELLIDTPESELALAAANTQLNRLHRSLKPLDGQVVRRRLFDFLLRRGFTSDAARKATDHLLNPTR